MYMTAALSQQQKTLICLLHSTYNNHKKSTHTKSFVNIVHARKTKGVRSEAMYKIWIPISHPYRSLKSHRKELVRTKHYVLKHS